MASASVTSNQKVQSQPSKVARPGVKPSAPPTTFSNDTNPVSSPVDTSKPVPAGTKVKTSPNTKANTNINTSKPKPAANGNVVAKTKSSPIPSATGPSKPKPATNTIAASAPSSGSKTKSSPKSTTKPNQATSPTTKPKPKTTSITPLVPEACSESESLSPYSPPPTFYSKAKDYWVQVPATVDGMLGGYSSLNVPDMQDSHAFLDKYGPKTTAYALDCGSGIGRVTKHLLLPRFNLVDMVELNQTFLDRAEEYIGAADFASVGERFCAGLQDFIPPRGRYDLVWVQWVLGHLTDIALVGFLKRCAQALSPGGRIVVKENVTTGESDDAIFDDVDSSFTRSRMAFLNAFRDAGLEVTGEELQTNFPASIYPVRMFAMRLTETEPSPPEAVPSEG